MPISKQIIGLFVFLLITFLAALIGSLFTVQSLGNWYSALPKPAWTPPGWLFGPVWTLLYTLMAVAAWLVWRRLGFAGVRVPLALYALQLVLNAGWTALFFGLRLPGVAFGEIVLLWLAILATLLAFWRVMPLAGALLIPYLAWVSYATGLNFAIWRMMTR